MLPKYALLSRNIRCGLVEEEHFGFLIKCHENLSFNLAGKDNNYPINMRSCMKPLQFAAISEIINEFDLTDEEIAVACASHVGEEEHINAVKSILKKACVEEKELLCPVQKPLSENALQNIVKNNLKITPIHNNCSGKHASVLAYCKLKGFSSENYNNPEHTVQKNILNFIADICEIPLKDCVIAKDGCTLPVLAMPSQNIAKGFLNIFTSEKYERIKTAIINNPYLFGGKGRLDSELTASGKGRVIAKVGAGNICCAVDLKTETSYFVKLSDGDNFARALNFAEFLFRENVIDIAEKQRLDKIFSPLITDENGMVLGKTEFVFAP